MQPTRRQFFGQSAALADGSPMTPYVFTPGDHAAGSPPAKNDQFGIGAIGMRYQGSVITEKARPYCEALKSRGLLCKETHDLVIRLSPPLVVSRDDLAWAVEQLRAVFSQDAPVRRLPMT